MEFLLENLLNLIGFLVGLIIGVVSYLGYKNTGSPTLFRLTIAFFLISLGFFVVWLSFMLADFVYAGDGIDRSIQTAGIAAQTAGYFFIAFSHGIKSFLPKSRYLRSVGIFPLFLVSAIHVEHIFRSVSFILLVYAAIETTLSYFESKKKGTLFVGFGLSLLAFGEFVGWYSFVFPESILYYASIAIKIIGLISIFIPVGRISVMRFKIKETDL